MIYQRIGALALNGHSKTHIKQEKKLNISSNILRINKILKVSSEGDILTIVYKLTFFDLI